MTNADRPHRQPAGQRGRPRGPRYWKDLGTPEQQARRLGLAVGGDPALTEYPLGLMFLRGLASREQHEAGCYYAYLYGTVIGRTQVTCGPLYGQLLRQRTAELSDAELAEIQAAFRLGKNRLLASGRRVCDATENLVVFGRFARFLDGGRRRPLGALRADATEFDAVLRGLDVLAACYGRAAGRLGRMELHTAPSLVQAAE